LAKNPIRGGRPPRDIIFKEKNIFHSGLIKLIKKDEIFFKFENLSIKIIEIEIKQ